MHPSKRYTVAGVVCLVGGSLAVLVQWLLTPVDATLSTPALLRTVAEHHTAMGWALLLDVPILLVIPAVLFAGRLAGTGSSRLADVATALCFVPMLGSVVLLAFDALVFEASTQADRPAAASLVKAFQDNAFVGGLTVVYLVTHLVAFPLLAVALRRAHAVPLWAAIALGVWPALEMGGYAAGLKIVATLGYACLVVGYAACAARLVELNRGSVEAVGPADLGAPERVS